MEALILVGHGSLRAGSGAAMIRLAARLRERGAAPLVAASFLNYSQPAFGEALERLVAQGATSVVLQPYFLVPGDFVRTAIPRLLAAAQAAFPWLGFTLAGPLGARPALAALAQQRADEAGATAASAVLLAAHGSHLPSAAAPLRAVAAMLRAGGRYSAVEPCYLSLNAPDLPGAIAARVAAGQSEIVIVPYMLQYGDHVAEDLPALVEAARVAHPVAQISLAQHLGYDPLLADAVAESVADARRA